MYRRDLWEIAASHHGVVTIKSGEEAGIPAVEVRKLASRGALRGFGQGVYVHQDVPASRFTQPMIATALAGEGSFLQRESVFDLLEVGHFNPPKVRVGTRRRIRRALPEWMKLEPRHDVNETDLTSYRGIPATTIQFALQDMRPRMPHERWAALLDEALRRELIDDEEAAKLRAAA